MVEVFIGRIEGETQRNSHGRVVKLSNGAEVLLRAQDPRSGYADKFINYVRDSRLAVYVRKTEDTTFLTVPLIGKVLAIRMLPAGDIGVEIERSAADHLLRKGGEEFERLYNAVQAAFLQERAIAMVENDDHEILDVAPLSDDLLPPLRLERAIPAAISSIGKSVPYEVAEALFESIRGKTCDTVGLISSCIPFNYPDDGCYARAHEICRLLADYAPRKFWSFGFLVVSTVNNPKCEVRWRYHVAPALYVAQHDRSKWMIFDPSLFDSLIDVELWKSSQGKAVGTMDSDVSFYCPLSDSTFSSDPLHTATVHDLIVFRAKLLERAVSAAGAPPYAACAVVKSSSKVGVEA